MNSTTIICFGEILWDLFPSGKMLGGAPFNVASSIKGLGGDVEFISRVGDDELGKDIRSEVLRQGISTELLQSDPLHETGKVIVTLDDTGSAQYKIAEDAAWDFIEATARSIEKVQQAKAFVFGSLVARASSKASLLSLLKASTFSVFDLNLRPPFYDLNTLRVLMKASQMLKFNDDEIYEIATQMGSPFHSLDQHITFISQETNTDIICVTKGSHGAVLLHNKSWYYNSGYKIKVVDTVGAGDSFLATLVLGLVKGDHIQTTLDLACGMGALVAGSKGANPLISKSDLDTFVRPK